MPEQLFREIRSIEQEAEKIISDSEKQSAVIIKKANEQAVKILSEKDLELKELRAETIKATLSEASKLKERKLEKSRTDLNELRALANKRKDKAANLILGRLPELIGE